MLELYNSYYNLECSSLSHGVVSHQELQAIALESLVKCFTHDNQVDSIPVKDILKLAKQLSEQGKSSYTEIPNY